jgi:hypothetical protein
MYDIRIVEESYLPRPTRPWWRLRKGTLLCLLLYDQIVVRCLVAGRSTFVLEYLPRWRLPFKMAS